MGYHRAGFEVVGVDIEPQPHYPFEFHQADAMTFPLDGFDVIHASPPCQGYSVLNSINKRDYPMLVSDVRARLAAAGAPYVIENVVGAPLIDPIMLCGAMFAGLRVYRHRLFEIGGTARVSAPPHPKHSVPVAPLGRAPIEGQFIHVCGHFNGAQYARKSMGIDWMTRDELSQSIPPAYTQYVGEALLSALESPMAA